MILYRTMDFFYVVVYFYFFPFLVVYLVNTYGSREISLDTEDGKLQKIDFKDFLNNKAFQSYYNTNSFMFKLMSK